jgi:hypothetical protein
LMNCSRSIPGRVLAGLALAALTLMALACFEDWLNPNSISLEEARQFDEFPLYWLSEAYASHDLNKINSWGSEPGDEYYTEPGVTITYGKETCVENSS